ncbi:hypothetical protein [Umezawaea sp. Da 62-37]|uniref:hypothetical protein n=1 Tax=Umezawaea sp. Da 62-37 TaxID=3075927 RepID=UPI0028F6E350|nr:hypothetical protein [Umezawaea sp. Da 62-37]WNV86685.1 hypothetical protein RM788_52665 [Umezawaea sp. Da 62-37]WNV86732.1 hypothetical protein RM788_00140 [Umezawaea sp. Da 62-37]
MNADGDGRDDIEDLLSRQAPDISWVADVPPLTFEDVQARAESLTADEQATVDDDMRRIELGHGALELARGYIAMGDLSTAEYYLTMATNYGVSGVNSLLGQIDELRAELPSYERNDDGSTNTDLYSSSFQWARNIVDDAKTEAAQIVDDALSTMKRVISQAQERASEIVAAARAEAAAENLLDTRGGLVRDVTGFSSPVKSEHVVSRTALATAVANFLLVSGAKHADEHADMVSKTDQHGRKIWVAFKSSDFALDSWLFSWQALAAAEILAGKESDEDLNENKVLPDAPVTKTSLLDFSNGLWHARERVLPILIPKAALDAFIVTSPRRLALSREIPMLHIRRRESDPIPESVEDRPGGVDDNFDTQVGEPKLIGELKFGTQIGKRKSAWVVDDARDDCKK